MLSHILFTSLSLYQFCSFLTSRQVLARPFVINLIGGQLSLVIGMIIITSIAVPIVLPSIVYAFVNTQFETPLMYMVFLLSIALFTLSTYGDRKIIFV
jgi:hypothetical protein